MVPETYQCEIFESSHCNTLPGYSGETYAHGVQLYAMLIGASGSFILNYYTCSAVFHSLKITSVTEVSTKIDPLERDHFSISDFCSVLFSYELPYNMKPLLIFNLYFFST